MLWALHLCTCDSLMSGMIRANREGRGYRDLREQQTRLPLANHLSSAQSKRLHREAPKAALYAEIEGAKEEDADEEGEGEGKQPEGEYIAGLIGSISS